MTATAMTAPGVDLERSYRWLLRALPPAYRRDREREMVDVMLELSPPDRRRPGLVDAFDVAAIAIRQWLRVLFLPSRGEARTAGAALAVILPLVLAYPVVSAAGFLRRFLAAVGFEGSLPILVGFADWPAWLLWTVAISCVLFGKSSVARWSAAAGTLLYSAYFLVNIAMNKQGTVVMSVGWLIIQIVALRLLTHPGALEQGRRLVPGPAMAAIVVTAGGLGFANVRGFDVYRILLGDYTPYSRRLVAVAVAGGALACLVSATGRAVAPFLTGLLVPLVAVRFLLPYLFNYRTSAPTFRHLPLKEAATGALALVVVYVGCRLAASVVARVRDRLPSPRGTPPRA